MIIFSCLILHFQVDWVYTHRTALSNQRFQAIDGDRIQLSYKDYRDNNRWKTMILSAEELLRRFLLHVLPKGLMRIRHYGFLALSLCTSYFAG